MYICVFVCLCAYGCLLLSASSILSVVCAYLLPSACPHLYLKASPCQFLGARLCLSTYLSVGFWMHTSACVHVYLCAFGVGELNRLYPLCSGCLHRGVWICGSTWQGDDHFCCLLWPIRPPLVWSPLILFLSFSSPLSPPAQSVEGTLELSRGVVSGIWVLLRGSSTPSSLLPTSPKR